MDRERQFQQNIKHTLDRQQADDATRDALRAARINALSPEKRGRGTGWIAATAFGCLLLIVIGLLVNRGEQPGALPQMSAEELAVIASEDELELLEELEFYIWFDKDKNV